MITKRVILVTPLRDEIDNIPHLFSSVASQDTRIDAWIIVENGSTDGSVEALQEASCPPNVERLVILNHRGPNPGYALGANYAGIVKFGFDYASSLLSLEDSDFIGILDADSFPRPNYYSLLLDAFDRDLALGLSSGSSVEFGTGRSSGHAQNWVRGSCRLWRGSCFKQSGYIVGPSADTLSLAKAIIDGWSARVVREAIFEARDVGGRSDFSYYGKSAYFRGNTWLYALLRCAKLFSTGRPKKAVGFANGFFGAAWRKDPRVADLELRDYFRNYVWHRLSAAISR